jgi:hypothetical protein
MARTEFGRTVAATVGEGVYSGDPDNVDEVVECSESEGWIGALVENLAASSRVIDELNRLLNLYNLPDADHSNGTDADWISEWDTTMIRAGVRLSEATF